MKFSKFSLDIINEIRDGNGDVAVEATAGAGKTTTLMNCFNVIPKNKKTIFTSFSKAIVNELKEKVPSHVQAKTLHSLGAGMIYAYYKGLNMDEDKYFKLALDLFEKTHDKNKAKENFKHSFWIRDIINFARMTLTPFDKESLGAMCRYYNIDFTDEILGKAIMILKDIGKKKFHTIDFTDMIYLPVIKPQLITQQYDYILWDEAQDANKCQKAFINLLRKPKSRLISVGDSNQSIYSFAGSTIDSFKELQSQPNTKIFSLPISYRCPKAVVALAQGVYDVIQYHEDAIEGDVRMGGLHEIEEGDMVLCRNTLPLVNVYFKLIEMDKKATIIGKDIEAGLIEFAKKVGGYSFEQIKKNMDVQLEELRKELKEIGFIKFEKHQKYVNLIEKIQVISLILNKIEKPNDLIDKIHSIFAEDKKAARLMTIHRSKGLEANRVFILESFNGKQLIPSEYAIQEWEKVQEKNLEFVAYTRSKNEVILFDVID